MLPSRDRDDEDAFTKGLLDADPEQLLDLVIEAVDERRLQLAARIAGLLDMDEIDADPESPLGRALAATRLLLVRPSVQGDPWPELDEAMAELRAAWMYRARRRHRSVVRTDAGDLLGFSFGLRRRR